MKNVEQNENSPVEMIYKRLKRIRMNEIDGRERVKLWEEKGGKAGKQRHVEGRTNEYLGEKTPVENIEERRQGLRTGRMDTRLRIPVRRRRGVGGWEKKRDEE